MQRIESGDASTAGESGCRQYKDVTLCNKYHPIVSHMPHTLLQWTRQVAGCNVMLSGWGGCHHGRSRQGRMLGRSCNP